MNLTKCSRHEINNEARYGNKHLMKTCFISAPVNVDLSVLRAVLRSQGIDPILPFELEITGANFREQIEQAIRRANFFIAVLSASTNNSNVFFELGYAWAKRKRVVLIQNRDLELPPNLSDFPILKCKIDDKKELSSFLEQFFEQQRSKSVHSHEITKTKPLSTRARCPASSGSSIGRRRRTRPGGTMC